MAGSKPNNEETVFINEKQASMIDGLSVAWHQRKRWEGGGPPYVKVGRAVRYKRAELVAWFESRKQHNTAENDQ